MILVVMVGLLGSASGTRSAPALSVLQVASGPMG